MDAITKRARELGKAVQALSNGIKAKEAQQKPKSLDFLNNLTGLSIPKTKKPEIKPYKPDVKKNLDYLQKRTGLPIPQKKEVKKDKTLKFVDRLNGISHSEITQDALVEKMFQKAQTQLGSIKSELLAEIGVLRAESIIREANNLVISDELIKEFIQRLKTLPENEKLDVTDIRNFQSFIYKGHRYGIEELMHGGGGGTGNAGLTTFVDGTLEGLLTQLNFAAGSNMTLTYSIVGGVPTITFSSTGGSTTAPLAVVDLSPQANGVNKTFIIPTNTSVLEVIGSDSPFIYRQGVDYTVSGTILTFTSAVNAPSSGSTLLAEYIPSGATMAFYDLSSQTDGLTTVFTVPAHFSVLSLRGSDFPFVYEEGVDFTDVGTILNIFTPNAPSAGSTLIFDYAISSPTATKVDLTPQVNGTNMVFIIPTITSAIALTGTDAPNVYRQGFDYVISGTTLTLIGVNPPTGTLELIYV